MNDHAARKAERTGRNIASTSTRPRSMAAASTIPDEENPGYYSANVWLRPHFQLEGMDIGMSLVASLAERKG